MIAKIKLGDRCYVKRFVSERQGAYEASCVTTSEIKVAWSPENYYELSAQDRIKS